MKQFIIVLAVLLTSCSRNDPPVSPQDQDYEFVTTLTDPYYDGLPKEALIPAAKALCAQLDQGVSFETVVNRSTMPSHALAEMITGSVRSYCPQHLETMHKYIGN